MSDLPSHIVDRAETRAAKIADRKRVAQGARAEHEQQQRARDEKTERLKAMRLAREAQS
ncbi:hypothetical protein J2X36_003212 [Methylobacterium sp. BE186]|uniref:hypothetical protein n=1 Tax=Methylobacterium sp. BE186 TaxID=2817715 RepID=UPI002862BF81|nr:hypothetical protein [Methylobacterium sp. BE186]MDR7038448.1 hypothetical protein [Methylobacterium sp. BE186]